MIDQKGRLFGKVNLLDLVVVLAVLAVAGRFGLQQFTGATPAPTGQDQPMEIIVKLPVVSQPTVDALPVGTEIYESKSNTYMGRIVAATAEPALVVTRGDDGFVYEQPSTRSFDYYITIAGPGRVAPNAIMMAGLEMKIGRMNYLRTALWAGQGPTWVIDTAPPQR